MNEMSPRPPGAGLRWGRGIVHKSASQRKTYSRGLGVWPVFSLLTSTQTAHARCSPSPPCPKMTLAPFPETPGQNSKPPLNIGTGQHAPSAEGIPRGSEGERPHKPPVPEFSMLYPVYHTLGSGTLPGTGGSLPHKVDHSGLGSATRKALPKPIHHLPPHFFCPLRHPHALSHQL